VLGAQHRKRADGIQNVKILCKDYTSCDLEPLLGPTQAAKNILGKPKVAQEMSTL
jgi:hypothetical protein